MVILAFLAVQGIMAMRIVPVYINDGSVKTIMNDITQDPDVKGLSAKKLKELLKKRLKINNLYHLAKDKEAFKFSKIKDGYHLTAHYETRGPIFKNLEFVVTFHHEVDIPIK